MHRVYVHDGDIWTLASAYRHELTGDNEYVVFETQRPPSYEEVCFVTDDGRRLCDFGPEHAHGD